MIFIFWAVVGVSLPIIGILIQWVLELLEQYKQMDHAYQGLQKRFQIMAKENAKLKTKINHLGWYTDKGRETKIRNRGQEYEVKSWAQATNMKVDGTTTARIS